ncbi:MULTISPECIES: beta-lactamase hydrolase domain-containing protein [Salinisphaera]|jgi:uncharacterized protein (TIGR01244 family)|uniref:Beta-lactamase hydrolase domain-containing protein n=1 Tax=Salinisphaera aquimarina TaxID=2094031 RepID=A0ABV7EJM9_9GAMM|tara:strand:+ start:486 stop:932 length:447 start_codon:yes stop_codon:yes gene_type:complete
MTDYASNIANAHPLENNVVAAGQPSAAQLKEALAGGVRTVVNLRPAGEFDEFDEAALIADAGMHYVHIPVAGPEDINDASARTLDAALAEDQRPAIVHCGSSNRVGGLMAYRARYLQGKNADEALQVGLDAGLNPESPLFAAIQKKLD